MPGTDHKGDAKVPGLVYKTTFENSHWVLLRAPLPGHLSHFIAYLYGFQVFLPFFLPFMDVLLVRLSVHCACSDLGEQ